LASGSFKVLKNQVGPALCRSGFFLGRPLLSTLTTRALLFA
jgi:hypothetical protein